MSTSLLGKSARVTAAMSRERLGEVIVSVGQGSEVYFAYAAESSDVIPEGTQVIIVEESPGRTVFVSRT